MNLINSIEEFKKLYDGKWDWCRSGFKHLRNNHISDSTDEELDAIINQLKSKQFFY